MKALIIMPAYNEHRSILNVIERVEFIEPKVDHLVVND